MTTRPPVARSRTTWQRRAVLRAIETAPCHLAADEIHRRLQRGRRRIGLATVYRALEAFVREGVVESVHIGDGRVRYGLAARHHDHLVCLTCGAWEPLEECPVPAASGGLPSGFAVTGHRLEVFGYCARCREADR
ncbi:MAG: transcriptional repressor [Armatimonadota bacterium]|nr:transcriptional repressor [Armatimonadota bacterium]